MNKLSQFCKPFSNLEIQNVVKIGRRYYQANSQLIEIKDKITSRDVFLDNVNERTAIMNQLTTLARLAKKRGWAVAIGHDRSLTLQVIQERLPWLKEQGIELVTVKEIIAQ